MTQPNPEQTFDQWCIVEIFGHERIAGRVTSQVIGGASFVRVDVPECNGQPAFTRMYGEKAIYSITPVSEEIATRAATAMHVTPVNVYQLPAPVAHNDDDFDDDEDQPSF